MNNQKTILVFVDWFVPGTNAGGPIRSVYSLVKYLKKDFKFRIFTRNTDHQSETPYPNVKPDQWLTFDENVEVFYCSKENLNKSTLSKIISEINYDKIYINSFYSPWFSIYPLQLIKKKKLSSKVVLAPRGMLGKGAIAVKPLKKKLFIQLAKLKGLHKGITWQASSEHEAKDISNVFGNQIKLKIAGNLSYIEQHLFQEREKSVGQVNLFFLSRIVPIKNLLPAIEALQSDNESKIVFHVFGPIEDAVYWEKCKAAINSLPPNCRVEYKGVLNEKEIQKTLKEYHALYMPTLNENFGHSILESFAAGCMVIISDQTPWNNLESLNIGYNIKVNEIDQKEQMKHAISAIAQLDKKSFNEAGLKAYSFAHFYLMNNLALNANKKLFE